VKSPENCVLRIGAWRVDPALDEISRDGQTVKLEPKLMRLLVFLARHPGQVVSVDQLLSEVWKDLIVSSDSVYHAVAVLRRLLGDDTKHPVYIVNVLRRGYRLVAPVTPVDALPVQPTDRPDAAESIVSPSPKETKEDENSNMHAGIAAAAAAAVSSHSATPPAPPRAARRGPLGWIGGAASLVVGALIAYLLLDKLWISRRSVVVQIPAVHGGAAAPPVAFNPPPHSIAVLPFVNIGGDKEQEYFSDGLTEELLNSIARINELQVAARTSSFYFKGEHADLATVAHRLNVASVLEGSVRRSANTVRVTAQLTNAVTGFHLWSRTYDRNLGEVLALQSEIATAVADALKVTLLGDVAASVELGGTHNPAAFDTYLRGAKAFSSRRDAKDIPPAIAAYTEAIRLDPRYALAFAARSLALSYSAAETETIAAEREGYDKALADAREALALAPDLAQAHLALALVSDGILNFTQASEAFERALALAPGNAEILREGARFEARMGHFDAGVAAARRAVVLDPLARQSHTRLGQALYAARRYQEAVAAFAEVISLDPDFKAAYGNRGLAYYGLGDLERARTSCETKPDFWLSQWCLAVIYDKLGRHADAQTALAKMKAAMGDTAAYQYATIYAQWENKGQALEWLDTALRQRDAGLEYLKTDPLVDPLRREPRFQAIERELKFPR
jgi:TolB-like protein/DNA-binding winged helix-turn-helix (wHTH) protein/tetratricopeptide (TPR) repeat protein